MNSSRLPASALRLNSGMVFVCLALLLPPLPMEAAGLPRQGHGASRSGGEGSAPSAEDLQTALSGADRADRWEAIRRLEAGTPQGAAALLQIVLSPREDTELQQAALDRIEDARSAPLLGEVLCCAGPQLRRTLIDDLDLSLGSESSFWDEELLALYAAALRDPDPELRGFALEEIAADPWFRDARVTGGLLEPVLRGDASPEVRKHAVALLARLSGAENGTRLLSILREETDRSVLLLAARSLCARSEFGALREEMLRLFRNGDPATRRRLSGVLGHEALAAALPDLIDALSDADPEVQEGAAVSLRGLGAAEVPGIGGAALPLLRILTEEAAGVRLRGEALATLSVIGCREESVWERLAAYSGITAAASPAPLPTQK